VVRVVTSSRQAAVVLAVRPPLARVTLAEAALVLAELQASPEMQALAEVEASAEVEALLQAPFPALS
jgi:hypothetical protein